MDSASIPAPEHGSLRCADSPARSYDPPRWTPGVAHARAIGAWAESGMSLTPECKSVRMGGPGDVSNAGVQIRAHGRTSAMYPAPECKSVRMGGPGDVSNAGVQIRAHGRTRRCLQRRSANPCAWEDPATPPAPECKSVRMEEPTGGETAAAERLHGDRYSSRPSSSAGSAAGATSTPT
jgi:hypothetical protein